MHCYQHAQQQLGTRTCWTAVFPSHNTCRDLLPLRIRSQIRSGVKCQSLVSESAHSSAVSSGCSTRRQLLCAPGAVLLAWACQAVAAEGQPDIDELQADAYQAYANRQFQTAVQKLTDILQQDRNNPRWLEMRAQVLVDGKNFDAAISDFNEALQITAGGEPVSLARLYAGRALAYEGLSEWRKALDDYTRALDLAQQGGESPDPYIINSLGNCHNSLKHWEAARESYLASSQLFQQAKGFRGRGGTTTQRLDGAIYAASNAALMLAQMGGEKAALKEFERITRRAPGSVDTRAALAALYWRDGRVEEAEDVWNFACEKISTGCRSYQDVNWLSVVRRWPPVMVAYLQDFLALNQTATSGSLKQALSS